MKIQVYLHIAIRLIILVAIGMMLSFVPDMLRVFFGDTVRKEPSFMGIDIYWDWGAIHYWYFWGVILLFSIRNEITCTLL